VAQSLLSICTQLFTRAVVRKSCLAKSSCYLYEQTRAEQLLGFGRLNRWSAHRLLRRYSMCLRTAILRHARQMLFGRVPAM
jgi:hypothetical protein